MKRLFALIVFLTGNLVFAQFVITDYGTLRVENLEAAICVHNQKWFATTQNVFSIETKDRSLKKDKNHIVFSGTMKGKECGTSSISANYILFPNGKDCRCNIEMKSSDNIRQEMLTLNLPLPQFLHKDILFDGQKVNFPAVYDKRRSSRRGWFTQVTLNIENGKLIIQRSDRKKFMATLLDGRTWKNNRWFLQLSPTFKQKHEVRFEFDFQYLRSPDFSVDLKAVSNMSFRDEVAEDGQGGWSDSGSDNDLRSFPTGRQIFKGIEFDIIKPENNHNRSCIVLRGPERKMFPEKVEIRLESQPKGKYLYILHANGWEPKVGTDMGEIICEYTDNTWVEKQLQNFQIKSGIDTANFWRPRQLPNAEIAWKGKNPSSIIGIYMTKLNLREQKIKKITIRSSGKAVWMIVGLTISDKNIAKGENLSNPVILAPGKDYIPVTMGRNIQKGSVLDLSGFLDAPAGKYGFVRCKGDSFVFENAPNKQIRFYGANLSFSDEYWPKKHLEYIASDLASMGYNILRINFDGYIFRKNDQHKPQLKTDRMDEIDYLISECRKRGIYVWLELNMGRHILKGALKDFPEYSGSIKKIMYISSEARKNWLEFSSTLLNHVNPYTQKSYKNESAVAFLCLNNENTVFTSNNAMIQKAYDQAFEEWQEKKTGEKQYTRMDAPRLYRNFLMELHAEMIKELRDGLSKIGDTHLITDMNFWATIETSAMRRNLDFADVHTYWSHPSFPKKAWSLPYIVPNTSSCESFANGVSDLFAARLLDRPFTVSEWNFCQPNCFAAEGAFLMGAYASMQNWNLLAVWAYMHGQGGLKRDNFQNYFDIIRDPLRRLSGLAGVLFFLREDVQRQKECYPFVLSNNYAKTKNARTSIPDFIRRLGLVVKTGIIFIDPAENPVLPKETKAIFTIDPIIKKMKWNVPVIFVDEIISTVEEVFQKKVLTSKEINLASGIYQSSCGTLTLAQQQGSFSVKTARSEGFVLKEGHKLNGNFSSVFSDSGFAAVLVAAMDQKTLKDSDRYLILHLTDLKNTGMTFENADMDILTKWSSNKGPMLMRNGKIRIVLNRNLTDYILYAVDYCGRRIKELPFKNENGKAVLQLQTDLDGKAVSIYEMVRK